MSERKFYIFVYSVLCPLFKVFMPFKPEGAEKVPEGAVILCGNHSHLFDPLLITFCLGRKTFIRHVAKEENRRIPVLGWLMYKAGSIFVHRDGTDFDSVRACLKALANGEKLMIFPEGTRVKEGEHVEPKDGAVYLASKKKVPVVPIYVPRKKRWLRTNLIRFGEPYVVEAPRGADMAALSRELMARIEALGEEK